MKILEEGKGWSIKERCTGKGNGGGGCDSLLLIEESDLYITSHTDLSGETDYFYTFRCIKCGRETDVEANKIPYAIRSKLLDDKKGRGRTLHR